MFYNKSDSIILGYEGKDVCFLCFLSQVPLSAPTSQLLPLKPWANACNNVAKRCNICLFNSPLHNKILQHSFWLE